MKKLLTILSILGFLTSFAFAQTEIEFSKVNMKVQEEDGSPATYPHTIKVTNGTLTDNEDGTVSITTGGGGAGGNNWTMTADSGTDQLIGDAAETVTLKGTAAAGISTTVGATNTWTIVQTKADTSTNGYLWSTDWNTFNNKYGAGGTDVAVADGGTGRSSWTLYDIPYASGTTTLIGIPIGTANQVLAVNAGANGYNWTTDATGAGGNAGIHFDIDGGGSAITTGAKAWVRVPFNMTITGWDITADQSGSIVIDVWKDTYANFPPTVADTIAGSEKPTLTSAQKNQDTTLTTWTTSVMAGDYIRINVDSITTVTKVAVDIYGVKN